MWLIIDWFLDEDIVRYDWLVCVLDEDSDSEQEEPEEADQKNKVNNMLR